MIQWNTCVTVDFNDFSEHPNSVFPFLGIFIAFENFSYSPDVFPGSNLPTAVSFRIPGRTVDETTTNCKARVYHVSNRDRNKLVEPDPQPSSLQDRDL